MYPLRGSLWGPRPLPEFLLAQLDAKGLAPGDAPACIRTILARPGAAVESSLFVDLGACKFLEGDVDGAIASWRHSISSTHDEPAARALLNLGLLYEHLELHGAALGVLGSVVERGDDAQLAAAAMATARCQQAAGDGDDAMETMARLAQSTMVAKPDSTELAEVLYGLGEVAELAGRVDRAERAWRVASVSAESAVQQAATLGLIRLLLDQGHDDELPEVLDRVSSANGQAGAVIDRAETLARLGSDELATALLKSVPVIDLGVNDRFRVADVRLQIGLVNEAIDDLELLLGHVDGEAHHRAAFTLGEIYRTYEMREAAASMYERVIDGGDRYWSPKAMLALGDSFLGSGDIHAAREQWAEAANADLASVRDLAKDRITNSHSAPTSADPTASADVDRGPSASGPSASAEVERASATSSPSGGDAEERLTAPVAVAAEATVAGDAAEPPNASIGVRPADLEQLDDADPSAGNGEGADPVIIVLAELDDDGPDINDATSAAESSVPNPYAALAPDGHESDVAPSTRNPYAELAPNFSSDDFDPSPDVEPGDWESMLDEGWPAGQAPSKPKAGEKKVPRAFSRYT